MSAGRYDTIIEQGATFSRVVTWKDTAGVGINLTSYSLAGSVKKKVSDVSKLFDFTFVKSNQGTNPGEFTFSLTATQTAQLPYVVTSTGGKDLLDLWYDIEATVGSNVYRIIEGILYNSPEVTR